MQTVADVISEVYWFGFLPLVKFSDFFVTLIVYVVKVFSMFLCVPV